MNAGCWRTFRAVFFYEIRQGLRSWSWWLLVLNFTVPVLVASASPFEVWVPFFHRVFLPVLLALAFLLVAPLVCLAPFEREVRPGRYDVFWVRLPHIGGALLAKALAGGTLVFLGALPVLGWTFGVALFYHGWDGLLGWGQACMLFLSAWVVYLAIAVVAWLLVPHPFGARVLSVLLMLGLVFLQDQVTLLHLWAPLSRLYFSHVTGFHPFAKLLLWHRLFWLALSSGLTLWALARLSRRAQRLLGPKEIQWSRRGQWVAAGLILVAGIPAFFFYREKARRFDELASNPGISVERGVNPNACPEGYRVDVTFDLKHLYVQGQASWQGTSIAPSLQAGLTGTLVHEGDQTRMTYQGTPRWPRQEIWCPECARDLTHLQRLLQPYRLGWYFVEGHLFLLMTGAWHPFPGCPMTQLRVRLEPPPCSSCVAVTGAPKQQLEEAAWVYVWEPPPGQGPLLVVNEVYRAIEQGGRRFLLPRYMVPLRVHAALAAPYWTTLQHMQEQGLISEHEAHVVAIVDQITYPRWSPEGLLFVPVPRSAIEGMTLPRQRYVALTLLLGWWCQGSPSCIGQLENALSDWSRQQVALPSHLPPEDPDRLAQQLASQEGNRSPEEISVLPGLLLYAAYRLHEPTAPYHPLAVDVSGTLADPLLSKKSPLVMGLLDTLYQQKTTHLWYILRAYRRAYGMQDVSLATFRQWMKEELGLSWPQGNRTVP